MADAQLPSSDSVAYRPFSGFAIAGFAVGALFALLVILSAAIALAQGVPLVFPIWILLVAIGGVVLSLIGQHHIRNSEGTLTGGRLANLGAWLSVCFGLGYFSYYYVTGLAIASQANAFVMQEEGEGGFFPKLLAAAEDPRQVNAAFLLTVPHRERGQARPDQEDLLTIEHDQPTKDNPVGPLTSFRQSAFTRAFGTFPRDQVHVEPLGVQGWTFENRSYHVQRNYRVTTPEVRLDVGLHLQSTEGEAQGEVRRWFVNFQRSSILAVKPTALAQGVRLLRQLARADLEKRLGPIAAEGYPGFGKLADWSRTVVNEDKLRDLAKARIAKAFDPSLQDPSVPEAQAVHSLALSRHDGIGDWRVRGGHLEIDHPFRLKLPPQPPFREGIQVDGAIVTRSARPLDLDQLDPGQFDETQLKNLAWEIASFRISHITVGDWTKLLNAN